MRGHNASVRDANSIQPRAKQHGQPDMRQVWPVTVQPMRLSQLPARCRPHHGLRIFKSHPNHRRDSISTARRRRGPRFARHCRLRTIASAHFRRRQRRTAAHTAGSRFIDTRHRLRRPALCQQREDEDDGAEQSHDFIKADAWWDVRLRSKFRYVLHFFSASGLHSHNHSALLQPSQLAVLYSRRAVTALAPGMSLY